VDLDGKISKLVDELAPELIARDFIRHEFAAQLLLTTYGKSGRLNRKPALLH